MNFGRLRPPLALQIGATAALFVAALGVLWYASTSVVVREERRSRAVERLRRAADLLADRGAEALARVRPYPEFTEPSDWDEIDRRLAAAAVDVRARFPDVEGGCYVPARRERPFVPPLPEARPAPSAGDPEGRNLYDHVETQADAAYRKRYALLVVEEIGPDTAAIQAAPVRVGGRVVASAWATTRLVDPIFLDRPSEGYQLFARLALAGIALSTALTFGLARTVRRQAAERGRLQGELRRSERLAALGRLLAGVAHEVRNPLAGIRSTAQLWQRGLGMDAESIEGLVQEADRLEAIVSSLLRFSRADAHDLAPGDLNAVAADAARLASGPASARGVRVEADLARGLPAVLISAPALLQVFRNLTANAVQATPRGGVVRLATRLDRERRAVLASVSDDGAGLSPEALGHLFEPFFTTKPDGTGLGLAIAREIALAHHGEIAAANRADGPGAVFTLALPVPAGAEGGSA